MRSVTCGPAGVAVDWAGFHAHEKLRRVPLPGYAFQRKKMWIGPKIGTNWLGEALGKVDDWFYRASWKSAPLGDGGENRRGPVAGSRRGELDRRCR